MELLERVKKIHVSNYICQKQGMELLERVNKYMYPIISVRNKAWNCQKG